MTAPGRVRGMSVSPAGHVERLELGSGLESAGAARRFTAASLVDICTEELVDVAMLLVSELATNALRHAVPPYALTLDIHLPTIEIAVEDGLDEEPIPRHPAIIDESGRGLVLVAELSSAWGVRGLDPGKSTWFVLDVDEPEMGVLRLP